MGVSTVGSTWLRPPRRVRALGWLAAPLAVLVAVALLPSSGHDETGSGAPALRARLQAIARSADATALDATVATLLSTPAFTTTIRALADRPGLDPSAVDLARAAATVSRSSSALAGRLLDTPATAVDRTRLDGLRRALHANPAVARLTAAGNALQVQPLPLQQALAGSAARVARATGAADVSRARPTPATLGDAVATPEFASVARATARVLRAAGAAGVARSLVPAVAASLVPLDAVLGLDSRATPASARTYADDRRALADAAALVLVAIAVVDGSRADVVVATVAGIAATAG